MELQTVVSCVAAVASISAACWSLVHRRPVTSDVRFALGLLALGAVQIFSALGSQADHLLTAASWKRWELVPALLAPELWLLFAHDLVVPPRDWPRLRRFVLVGGTAPLVLLVYWTNLFWIPPDRVLSSPDFIPLGIAGKLFHGCTLFLSILVLGTLETLLRSVRGTKRWQSKFLVLGLGTYFAASVYLDSQALLLSAIDRHADLLRSFACLVAVTLVTLSRVRAGGRFPEIQPSQGFLQGSLTFVLVGAYLVAVGLIAEFASFLGVGDTSPGGLLYAFISLVLLALLLLSDRIRIGLIRSVVRNVLAARYDYRKEWLGFTERTASAQTPEELTERVVSLVAATFRVDCVTIWLAHDADEQVVLSASTGSIPTEHGDQSGATDLLRTLATVDGVVDLREGTHPATVALRSRHADFLTAAHIAYGVVLQASSRPSGALTLDERVDGQRFSLEDKDLLAAIARQTAYHLNSLQVAQQLMSTKELEAFRTLSAFFVHDLKNVASTLSLTLQNLPSRLDDAEFRQDAFRALQNGLHRMDELCRRLSMLTARLEVRRMPTDLNDLVTRTIADLKGVMRCPVHQDLGRMEPVPLDVTHIRSILVNLLLNANDATSEGGDVAVSTRQRDRWVELTVTDTGHGIEPEFLARSLFHPFRTTKGHGLGIGLFQSKRLAEAHGGRIEVESTLSKGSCFRLLLPITFGPDLEISDSLQ